MTICTQDRENLFGNIVNGKMILNDAGKMVDAKINELIKYPNINIDVHVVMPNHVHIILIIVGADPCVRPMKFNTQISGPTQGSAPTYPLGEYIKRLKTLTTKIYIQNVKQNNWPLFNKRLWQRNFYERIIRNEKQFIKIQKYILNNPSKWGLDKNNLTFKNINS